MDSYPGMTESLISEIEHVQDTGHQKNNRLSTHVPSTELPFGTNKLSTPIPGTPYTSSLVARFVRDLSSSRAFVATLC